MRAELDEVASVVKTLSGRDKVVERRVRSDPWLATELGQLRCSRPTVTYLELVSGSSAWGVRRSVVNPWRPQFRPAGGL